MNEMLLPVFGRLLWKEWRIARSFTYALIGFGLALILLPVSWMNEGNGVQATAGYLATIATGFPLILLIGILATGFAAEHENNTFALQRSLPTGTWPVVLAKLVTAVGLAVVLFAILIGVASLIDRSSVSEVGFSGILVAAAELTAWGFLIGMLSRRPLVALIVASVVTVSVAGAITGVTSRPGLTHGSQDLLAMGLRWGVVVLVASAALWVAPRWFSGASLRLVPGSLNGISPRSRKQTRTAEVGSYGKRVMVKRLIWSRFREMAWFYIPLLIAVAVGFALSIGSFIPPRSAGVLLIFAPFLTAICGGLAFAIPDSQRRMLSMLSVSPWLHWLASLILPAVVTALVVVAVLPQVRRSDEAAIVFFAIPLAFVIGQLVSQWTRTTLNAIGISIAATVVVLFLVAVSLQLFLPFWVFVLPACVFALLATLLCHRGWLRDWHDRRYRFFSMATLVIPAVLLFAGVTAFRAFEYPPVSPQRWLAVPIAAPSVDPQKAANFRRLSVQAETASEAWRIRNREVSLREHPDSLVTPETVAPPLDSDLELLGRIREAVQQDRLQPTSDNAVAWHSLFGKLVIFLDHVVRFRIQESQSDDALASVVTALRLVESEENAGRAPNGTRRIVDGLALRVAAMPEITVRQTDSLIETYRTTMTDVEDMNASLAVRAQRLLRLTDADADEPPEDEQLRKVLAFQRWMPWEQIRTRRVIERLLANQAADIREVGRALRNRERPDLRPYQDETQTLMLSGWIDFRSIAAEFLAQVREQRATLIRLALAGWQKAHDGELPETLDAIADSLSEDTLIDPISAKPFVLIPTGLPQEWIERSTKDFDVKPIDAAGLRSLDQPFLWSPGFYLRRDPDSPSDDPRFFVRDQTEISDPLTVILADRVRYRHLLVQTSISGAVSVGVSEWGIFPIPEVEPAEQTESAD